MREKNSKIQKNNNKKTPRNGNVSRNGTKRKEKKHGEKTEMECSIKLTEVGGQERKGIKIMVLTRTNDRKGPEEKCIF